MGTHRHSIAAIAFCTGLLTFSGLHAGDEVASGFPRLDIELVAAVRFHLDKPYTSPWRQDRPIVSDGFVVALRSDGDLIRPHTVPDPNVIAGGEVVEIVYQNPEAGIVAGVIRERKSLAGLDLFWGAPRYADGLTAEQMASERTRAVTSGLRPVPDQQLRRALTAAPAVKTFKDRGALYDFAIELGKSVALAKPEMSSGP
jgi:hypothetical protein